MPFHRSAQQQYPIGFCWAFCRSGVCNEQQHASLNTNAFIATTNTVPLPAGKVKGEIIPNEQMPTPIKAIKLYYFLKGYDTNLRKLLIDGFTFGFSIKSSFESHVTSFLPNHISACDNPSTVNLKLKKEISRLRIPGPFDTPPFQNFIFPH